VARNLVV
jgi:hypothetical protein